MERVATVCAVCHNRSSTARLSFASGTIDQRVSQLKKSDDSADVWFIYDHPPPVMSPFASGTIELRARRRLR
eukprot:423994-Pyramimonas_sp.AAC.2